MSFVVAEWITFTVQGLHSPTTSSWVQGLRFRALDGVVGKERKLSYFLRTTPYALYSNIM